MASSPLPSIFQIRDQAVAFAWDETAGLLVPIKAHENALMVYEYGHGAGERAEDSTTGADHQAAVPECAISAAIDLSTDASTTVLNAPALLLGIWVEVTIGTAAPTIDDNATARLTVPIALPIGFHPLPGIIFETSLVVNPADTSTGTIRLCYRPLPATVTWAY